MHDAGGVLRVRQVNLANLLFAPLPIANVAYDSDNGQPAFARFRIPGTARFGKFQTDLLADGILIGPVAARQCFVEQCHALSIYSVGCNEVAPFLHGNAHGLQVAPIGHAVLTGEMVAGRTTGAPSNIEIAKTAPTRERKKVGRTG